MNIDNSKLEKFCKCPRSYYFYAVCKRESNTFRAGLEFGSIIHKCLDIKYRGLGDISALQRETLENFYAKANFAPDDYRNLNYATDLLALYDATYPMEPFTVCSPVDANIETAFSVPIGNEGDNWTGRIDLSVTYPDQRLWTLDHKTSSVGGAGFFDEYLNNQPQSGYVWAQQKLTGETVTGFIINAVFCRAKTKTGKGITFERQMFNLSQTSGWEKVWEQNTFTLIKQLKRAEAENNFPMHKHSCVGRYGKCEYLDVCSMPPSSQLAVLGSNMYRDVTWDPMKVD